MDRIINEIYDMERALYALSGAEIEECTFAGPADGESALKECRNISVTNCRFSLRYPLWHTEDYTLDGCIMDNFVRAPIWYAKRGTIRNTEINGVKCLRECDDTSVKGCKIRSKEFGWRCRGVSISNSEIDSVYFLFEASDVKIDNLSMTGKYSFQYVERMEIENSDLNTKDAFWHSKNVTVRNTVLKGEYLGWYSEGLTLIGCKIIGTQPLCYCKDLTLIDCTMEDTDLSFEYSDVNAEIKGSIVSVKNPRSGKIVADSYGEIIRDSSVYELSCEISVR